MLTPKGYRKRLIEEHIDEHMKIFGAVCIEGPKWCGKTWTGCSRAESVAYIGDPANNFQTRNMAQINPKLILEGTRPRLIDEWQDVPSIWDAVRFVVDQDQDHLTGKFILTGSSTPQHKGIMHSGTGRISKVRMNTMSLYETGDSSGKVSLSDIMKGNIDAEDTGEVELTDLIYYTVRGGWPGNIQNPERICGTLASEYLNSVVEDDMFKVDGVKRDIRKVWSLIHSLGRNESTIVSAVTIKKDIEALDDVAISVDTVSEYMSIFQRLFIIDDQPAYSINLRSSRRFLKAPKRHYADPSLAVAAVGATQEMLYQDLHTFGFLFEALCEHDLKIYSEYIGAKLFHLRDEKGNEADAIIELPDGSWGAFEIKLGANQIDIAAKELLKIKKIVEKESGRPPSCLCVICGMSNMAYTRDDGVIVAPITSLRP